MRAILSANVSHYHHAAAALAGRGWLARYVTSIVPGAWRGVPERLLPRFWRAKLSGRALPALDRRLVVSLAAPEALDKVLARTPGVGGVRSLLLTNWLFDAGASRHVEPCDVFHFVSSVGLRSGRKAKRLGAVVVCDERAEHPDFRRRMVARELAALGLRAPSRELSYERRAKAEYAVADHVVVPSEYAKRTFAEQGFDPDRVHPVGWGFEPALFAPAPERRTPSFTVLCVGLVDPRKGVHHLCEAFLRLGRRGAKLVVVGPVDPPMEPYVARMRARSETIEFAGAVPRPLLREHYTRAWVLAQPSVADAQPLVCLEAMACGLPVISTTNMGTPELARDGREGLVVPPGDVDALEAALRRIADDPDGAAALGRAARERALEYTWERYGERLLAAYETMVAAGPRERR